jgi:6-phosphogluconolactonase
MTAIQTEIFRDSDELARDVAERFIQISDEAIDQRGRAIIALAGGSTPKRLYQLLETEEYQNRIQWDRIHLFLGDERYVPLDHDDSNFRMIKESLLDRVPIPQENVHPVPTHLDAADAALAYEQEIRRVMGAENQDPVPAFDLVLLGIGGDGHTASLFPETGALQENERLVTENWVPQQESMRISFTIPLLQAARKTILMATGSDKCEAVQRTIEGERNIQETPCQILRDSDGAVTFALDDAAAARLSS